MRNLYFSEIEGVNFSTIRNGSSGPDVVTWQKIVGVEADGKFGPQTEGATRKWQRDHGLDDDGIVGPKTWGAASSNAITSTVASVVPDVVKSNKGLFIAGGVGAGVFGWWWWRRRHRR